MFAIGVFGRNRKSGRQKKKHRISRLQQQHNKSFNLTSPALRGERRSGAVKRAPQVNSNPLCCKHRSRSWCELSTKKKVGIWLRRDFGLGKVVHNRNIQFSLCRFVSSWAVQCPGVKRTRRLRKESKVRMPKAKASRFSFATAT